VSAAAERTFLRPRDGRMLGGVCAAVARRLGLDATLVRVAWIAAALVFGVGLVAYAILWLLIPEE
jgi:phage shock protein PspC (stress-responsive transcriptional regulator)